MFELRPYQKEAVQAIENEWNNGNKKTLLVCPTGTGKTQIFSSVIKDQIKDGSKALILAHRNELLDQASSRLRNTYGIETALEKAESTSVGSPLNVTVSSIQSLANPSRLNKFNKDYFKTIVVDEAHHCLADTYQRVLNHFENANVLGVTATPDKADHKNLGEYFDSKAFEYSMPRAIREGYLCPIRAQMIPLKLDINNVSVSNGDYAVGEIGNALEPYLNQIALEMVNYCKNKKTVVFLPLVKTSQKFTELLNVHGLRAVEVNGNSKDREERIKAFENGEYDVLCNSMLLTEGWDCPSVDCIVILRPTKVRSLYQQMVGRGMRLAPNKEYLLLLDFLWLTERHDLCKPSGLLAKNEEEAKKIDEKIANSGYEVDLVEAEEEAKRDIVAERENALKRELEEMRRKKRQLVDPIQYAFSINAEDLADYEPTFAWEMAPMSSKQKEYLEKHGIYTEEIANAGMASLIIDKLKNRQIEGLATPKQIRLLERYGFLHVGLWTFDDASLMITRIANNRWFVPFEINPKTYEPRKGIMA